jgi:hypothetical protein
LPSCRQLLISGIIAELALPIAKYDVPGGRDIDPGDHSTSR